MQSPKVIGTLKQCQYFIYKINIIEPQREISNNVVCVTSKGSDQPAHMRSLIKAFTSHLNNPSILTYRPNIIWSFFALKEAARVLLSLFNMSTCHIVVNHYIKTQLFSSQYMIMVLKAFVNCSCYGIPEGAFSFFYIPEYKNLS